MNHGVPSVDKSTYNLHFSQGSASIVADCVIMCKRQLCTKLMASNEIC